MIKSCNCGKCRKESEHNLGFVWERKGDRWFKMYSIKPRPERIPNWKRHANNAFKSNSVNR